MKHLAGQTPCQARGEMISVTSTGPLQPNVWHQSFPRQLNRNKHDAAATLAAADTRPLTHASTLTGEQDRRAKQR